MRQTQDTLQKGSSQREARFSEEAEWPSQCTASNFYSTTWGVELQELMWHRL